VTQQRSSEKRRLSGTTVAAGTVLIGFAALAVLVLLLLVSPAAFVSLMPGRLTSDGSDRTAAWLIAGLGAGVAAVLAALRGRAPRLRGVVITGLVVVAVVSGLYAFTTDPARNGSDPKPVSTCVAYSGGRHTCPGG
jgi:hypothetical protein